MYLYDVGNWRCTMEYTYPIRDLRQNISRIADKLTEDPDAGAITMTKRGKPVLAVMSWDLYESIVETLEVLGDETLITELRQGIREVETGKGVDWIQARKELEA
jgi:antitoxin YefM